MTIRYDILVDGYKARVILTAGDGPFTGTIENPDYGTGTISGTITGKRLDGKANMDGHEADVIATLEGPKITGTISVSMMFFSKTVEFSGELAA